MVTIAECYDLPEAQRLKMVLQLSDIPSFIPDETMASVAPNLFLMGSGVRLQVEDEHAVEAEKIVKEARHRTPDEKSVLVENHTVPKMTIITPFVKGLMCATLLQLGISSAGHVIYEVRHNPSWSSIPSLLSYAPGILALLLGVMLLGRSMVVARIAFGFLIFESLLHLSVPIICTLTDSTPPTSTTSNLISAFLYAFPCLYAVFRKKVVEDAAIGFPRNAEG